MPDTEYIQDLFTEYDGPNDTQDSLKHYLHKVGQYRLLNREEEIELAKRAKAGDKEAFDTLIMCNIRLVASIAKAYVSSDVPYMDLIQEGTLGLISAANKYDYTRGTKFGTYATWFIRSAVSRYIRESYSSIRLPANACDELAKIRHVQEELIEKNGTADLEAISEMTGISKKRVLELLSFTNNPLPLDQKVDEDSTASYSDLIVDKKNITPEQSTNNTTVKEELKRVMDVLDDRETRVIRLRFGMEDGKVKTLEETGLIVGIKREVVRQVQAKAMRKMKMRYNDLHSRCGDAEY